MRCTHATLLTAALGVALALAGCATPKNDRAGADDPCNPVVGAVIGGAVGALVGGDRRRTQGALVGAGLGALACVGYNYHARQTRSADQVGAEYRQSHGALPPSPVVTAYRTEASAPRARGGDEVRVTSTIEVVPGAREPLQELREEFAILDPGGTERSRIAKTPVPAGTQGGAFVSTLQFTFPKGVPPGAYQVASRLFVNGRPVQESRVKIEVARAGATLQPLVALR